MIRCSAAGTFDARVRATAPGKSSKDNRRIEARWGVLQRPTNPLRHRAPIRRLGGWFDGKLIRLTWLRAALVATGQPRRWLGWHHRTCFRSIIVAATLGLFVLHMVADAVAGSRSADTPIAAPAPGCPTAAPTSAPAPAPAAPPSKVPFSRVLSGSPLQPITANVINHESTRAINRLSCMSTPPDTRIPEFLYRILYVEGFSMLHALRENRQNSASSFQNGLSTKLRLRQNVIAGVQIGVYRLLALYRQGRLFPASFNGWSQTRRFGQMVGRPTRTI
jgi:hypothetical protein